MFADHFASLGSRLSERWSKYHFDGRTFPDLAMEELDRARTWDVVSASDVIPWVMGKAPLPYQMNLEATFGEPPVTLFWHPRFFIEALHWTVGTPSIHQHGFSGAFAVWEGSSVQSRFDFMHRRRINAAMSLGLLQLKDVRVLKKGDCERIDAGPGLVHSTFHLDSPSVTLVVRTTTEVEHQPQFSYHGPYLALDPFFKDPSVIRRIQLLSFLNRVHSPKLDGAVTLALANSDLYGTFRVLDFLKASVTDTQPFADWLEVAKDLHGDDVLKLDVVLEERDRQTVISSRRAAVTSPELRFFLALLMNLPSRNAILSAVRDRYPDRDAREQVLNWAFELSGVDLSGVEFDEVNRVLFRHLLDDLPFEVILAKLAEEFEFTQSEAEVEEVRLHCSALRQSTVFRSLFASSQ